MCMEVASTLLRFSLFSICFLPLFGHHQINLESPITNDAPTLLSAIVKVIARPAGDWAMFYVIFFKCLRFQNSYSKRSVF